MGRVAYPRPPPLMISGKRAYAAGSLQVFFPYSVIGPL